MNWDAIGAIAEALGAIGVVATVVYVALQIRQNSRSIEGATEQSLMDQEMNLYALLASHPSVFRRGCDNIDDLDQDENIEFQYLTTAVMTQLYSAFVQYQRKLIPHSVWVAYCADWLDWRGMHGFMQMWSNIQASYPIEFREALDSLTKE